MNKVHPTLHSASRHSDGRVFGRYHNDRQGETMSDNCHVNPKLSYKNIYYTIDSEEWYTHDDAQNGSYLTFKDAEDNYIKSRLKDAYEAQQERYRSKRQYKRCKDIDDWYEDCRRSGKITVDQVHIQLGNYDDGSAVNRYELADIVVDYINESDDWNKQHGVECVILSIAIHADEEVNGVVTPHAHINRIFFGKDDEGRTIAGQEEAFRQSDLLPPNPNEKVWRNNNCKMTLTEEHRKIYLDVCERHGIDIDRIPLPTGNKRHKEQDAYITQQNRKKRKENKELQDENEKLKEEAARKQKLMQQQVQSMQQQIDKLQSVIDAMSDDAKSKLNDSERVILEFGQAMSHSHADEFMQFLDDKFDEYNQTSYDDDLHL